MRGLYLHIPFCRQACRYCDFFFTVSLQHIETFTEHLVKELEIKALSFSGTALDSLYLGGGTPSLLSPVQLDRIISAIHRYFTFSEDAEWTLECNPDDVDSNYLKTLKKIGFNRISLGIQSFHDRELTLMHRSHDARQAKESVLEAANAGFQNITIDLIYGIPGQRLKAWEENIRTALTLPVTHISAYHLTFEKGTVFDHWREKGKLMAVDEEVSLAQYRTLRSKLLAAGFDHYEISNFARNGHLSKHNMLYWSGEPYLGLGPSAHSFDGNNRSWNIASLKGYLQGIAAGEGFTETEKLTSTEQYHDYLITSLRNRWGALPGYLEKRFGNSYRDYFLEKTEPFLAAGFMKMEDDRVVIDPEYWLITDHILKALFMD